MDQVSRPLLIVLVAAAAFLGVWLVALKPHGSGTSASAPAKAPVSQPAARQPAAHRPVPRHTAAPRPVHHAASTPRPAHSATRPRPASAPRSPGAATRLSAVDQALARGRVLALLFYNPAAADDQAVKQELAGVSAHGGKVFKLAVPLPEVASYAALTNQVPVNASPTLVIIDRGRHAQEIVGFADSFEIAQRLQDALAVPVAAG